MVCLRRPRAIVFDILGTASKSGFLERILFPYLKGNLDNYINSHWNKTNFKPLYAKIVEQAQEYNRQDPNCPLVAPHDTAEGKDSLRAFINYVTENNLVCPPVTQLRFKVWFEGYQSKRLRTPIYADVQTRTRLWYAQGVKFYVFSNTWVEAQRALLQNTNKGNLTNIISGYYDNDFGSLLEPESWQRLCIDIKENPNDVLFLTKNIQEAKAAAEAGLNVALVLTHRHNVKAVSHDDRKRFPFVRTFHELAWLEEQQQQQQQQPRAAGASGVSHRGPEGAGPTIGGGTITGEPTALSTSTRPPPAAGSASVTAPTMPMSRRATSGAASAGPGAASTATALPSGSSGPSSASASATGARSKKNAPVSGSAAPSSRKKS